MLTVAFMFFLKMEKYIHLFLWKDKLIQFCIKIFLMNNKIYFVLNTVFLPKKSPWTKEPGGLQAMVSQRVGYNWATKQQQQQILC